MQFIRCPKCSCENFPGNLICIRCGTRLRPAAGEPLSDDVYKPQADRRAAIARREKPGG